MCLVTKGNQILLQNRVKQDWRGYTLPGGHVEAGESFVDAVIREMKEETGLTIRHPRLVGIKQFPIQQGRYVVLLFKAEEFTGELASSKEGQMVWVPRDHLKNFHTVDDLDALLQVMDSPSLNEFQYVIQDGKWNVVLK